MCQDKEKTAVREAEYKGELILYRQEASVRIEREHQQNSINLIKQAQDLFRCDGGADLTPEQHAQAAQVSSQVFRPGLTGLPPAMQPLALQLQQQQQAMPQQKVLPPPGAVTQHHEVTSLQQLNGMPGQHSMLPLLQGGGGPFASSPWAHPTGPHGATQAIQQAEEKRDDESESDDSSVKSDDTDTTKKKKKDKIKRLKAKMKHYKELDRERKRQRGPSPST